jgi:2-methylcitrate dehydratase PrpD
MTVLREWVTRAQSAYSGGLAAMPAAVRRSGVDSFVDTVAVMHAGAVEDSPRAAADYVAGLADGGRCATVLGPAARPEHAVLVNATAAHAQDYDDAATALIGGHGSAVLVPVALAIGEHTGASGHDVLAAMLCGFEVTFALGAAVNPHLYEAGFHPTPILCAVGAAVTTGLLLDLDTDRLIDAASLGCSVASGIKGNFGSMAKALHCGWAAHGGITAAMLAASGLAANADIVERPAGFVRVYGASDDAPVGRPFGEPWYLERPGIGMRKAWPSCASTHATIECAENLAAQGGFALADVARIDAHLPTRRIPHTDRPTVDSPSAARFSQQFCAAAALTHGRLAPRHFGTEALQERRITDLMGKVALHPDTSLDERDPDMRTGADFCARLVLRTTGGAEFTATVDGPLGTGDRPLTGARLADKFTGCVEPVLGATDSAALLDRLTALPHAEGVTGLLHDTRRTAALSR